MIKLYKKIMELFIFIILGIVPFGVHFFSDIFWEIKPEYINYIREIYFFNGFIFGYIIISLINEWLLLNKLAYNILFLISFTNFMMLTIIYASTFVEEIIEVKENGFIFLCVLTLFNLIIIIIVTITYYEKNADLHNSRNKYKKYSENRYERYLLERIDEKLNSIKNQQSEKNEEKSNDTINSEELLSGSDILAEMLKNHIEIQEYFQISKNQSKFSFYFSICASVVGIIVVIIAASGIIIFKSLGISIIAAVSGAITEIISGIVLWIHNKSALQLNYYYDSLHENEKFLSALNIADKLSVEKREDMYMEIIRKQIDIQLKDKENNVLDIDKK